MDQRIATYQPRRPSPGWFRVADRVRGLMTEAEPLAAFQVAEMMSVLARLAIFCEGRGITDARAWLRPESIEHFLHAGCPDLSEGTRATYRARLRKLAAAVCPGESVKPVALPGSEASRPYTTTQRAALWSWAQGQPTAELRHGLTVLLALGLGAGLASDEIIQLLGGHVRACDNGTVVVHAPGPRRRLVVCRQAWETPLREAAGAVGSGFVFRPGAARRGKNTVTNFLGRTHRGPAVPTLAVARLRTSWLVDLLAANTPLTVVVAAAGLDTLHGLSRLLPFLPTPSADDAATYLRGHR